MRYGPAQSSSDPLAGVTVCAHCQTHLPEKENAGSEETPACRDCHEWFSMPRGGEISARITRGKQR